MILWYDIPDERNIRKEDSCLSSSLLENGKYQSVQHTEHSRIWVGTEAMMKTKIQMDGWTIRMSSPPPPKRSTTDVPRGPQLLILRLASLASPQSEEWPLYMSGLEDNHFMVVLKNSSATESLFENKSQSTWFLLIEELKTVQLFATRS